MPLFTVDNLSVRFGDARDRVRVVEAVSFAIDKGETLGLVGESGSGKSVTAMSSIRLLPSPPSHLDSGAVKLDGLELTTLPKAKLRELWGSRIGIIFQDPMTSLNPTFTIGFQLREALKLHKDLGDQEGTTVLRMLERVGINSPQRRLNQYPHELSGGLRQRVMIAMALICHPQLLIADEPTTALDVTLQAQILDLLRDLRKEFGMGILLITHDLGVVAELCDRVAVMYAGRIVETAGVREIFTRPMHPYTFGLMGSIPRLHTARGAPLVTIEGTVPGPRDRGPGCAFADRCSRAQAQCKLSQPELSGEAKHQVACFNPMPTPNALAA